MTHGNTKEVTIASLVARCDCRPTGRAKPCLIWTGAYTSRGGLPQAYTPNKRKTRSARRLMVDLRRAERGENPIRPNREVVVTCDEPGCLQHLRVVVRGTGVRIAAEKGVYRRSAAAKLNRQQGARRRSCANSGMSIEIARAMRDLKAEYPDLTNKKVGFAFGQTEAVAALVLQNRRWKETLFAASSIFALGGSIQNEREADNQKRNPEDWELDSEADESADHREAA